MRIRRRGEDEARRTDQVLRLSYESSFGDTFGHRADRVVAASHRVDAETLAALELALREEPNPAMKKLLALAIMRVLKNRGEGSEQHLRHLLEEAISWRLQP